MVSGSTREDRSGIELGFLSCYCEVTRAIQFLPPWLSQSKQNLPAAQEVSLQDNWGDPSLCKVFEDLLSTGFHIADNWQACRDHLMSLVHLKPKQNPELQFACATLQGLHGFAIGCR
jgi:DNA-binding transcriptional LysR family regulator